LLDGRIDGIELGKELGYREGIPDKLGTTVGTSLGNPDGTDVSPEIDGSEVGKILGIPVFCIDGLLDGSSPLNVTMFVGPSDCEGAPEGKSICIGEVDGKDSDTSPGPTPPSMTNMPACNSNSYNSAILVELAT